MLLDLASILPLDTVDVIVSSGRDDGGGGTGSLKAIRVVRLLRLMKLLRVLRGMRIFARWEARLALDYAVLTLQKFFITLLVAAHWLGCTLMAGSSSNHVRAFAPIVQSRSCIRPNRPIAFIYSLLFGRTLVGCEETGLKLQEAE